LTSRGLVPAWPKFFLPYKGGMDSLAPFSGYRYSFLAAEAAGHEDDLLPTYSAKGNEWSFTVPTLSLTSVLGGVVNATPWPL